MKRFALVALLGAAVAACSADPTQPTASLGKSKGGTSTTSPAMICYAQQLYVQQLIRRVEYLTVDPVKSTLLVPLNQANTALNPAACQPAAAIASLQEFIRLVNDFEASGAIYPSYATSFRSTANYVISNLQPLVI